jgi:hypothetical protein
MNLSEIRYINLSSNLIREKGLKRLIKRYGDKLNRLDIDHNNLEDGAIEYICSCRW